MATLKYITGLSRAGFRVPDNTGALQRVKKGVNIQVDLDDDKTRKILSGERDNFIRVASNVATTTTIIGLTRYGFRIKDSGGTTVTVKLGSGVHTIDLTNADAVRILRRSFGRWLYSTSATSATIRGIAAAQAAFQIGDDTAAGTVTLTSNNTNVTATDTVQIGATTYTFKASLTEVQATAQVSSTGTNPVAGDTITINNVTYRFESALAAANDVKIGATSDATLDSLVKAVNQTGVAGTDYFAGTVAPANVTAGARTGTGATGKVLFTAAVGTGVAANSYASTEASAQLSFVGATFTGGVNPVANEVKVGASADASLTNLSEAINKGANGGVDYSSSTVANAAVTASAVASHAITLTTANATDPSSITLATTEATYTFGSWAGGGVFVVSENVSATINPQLPAIYTQLRRRYKAYVEA